MTLKEYLSEERRMIKENPDLSFKECYRSKMGLATSFTERPHPAETKYFRVPIKNLRACQGYVNRPTVQRYKRLLRKGRRLECPRVSNIDSGLWVVTNGTHRVQALIELGRKTVVVAWH